MRLEIARLLFIAFLILPLVVFFWGTPWNYFDVCWRAWCALIFAALALVAPSRRVRVGAAALTLLIFAWAALYLHEAFPLRLHVEQANYEDQSVRSVLVQVRKQRGHAPYWRFFVDPQVATKRINLEIGAHATLGELLTRICDSTDCQFAWHWHGGGYGNEKIPICATFTLYPRGTALPPLAPNDWYVDIPTDL